MSCFANLHCSSLSYLKSRCTLKYELQNGTLFKQMFVLYIHILLWLFYLNSQNIIFPSYIASESQRSYILLLTRSVFYFVSLFYMTTHIRALPHSCVCDLNSCLSTVLSTIECKKQMSSLHFGLFLDFKTNPVLAEWPPKIEMGIFFTLISWPVARETGDQD